jgi:hypothetical protein
MKKLTAIRKSAAPLTMRMTLNDLAYVAAARAHGSMKKRFVLRNKWTQRGLVVEHAKQREIRDMRAIVGHRAEYMLTQEEGGTVRGRKSRKPIPTRQARISKSTKKVVRKAYRMRNLNVSSKYFVASPGGRLGIFQRIGRRGKRVVMLWDLSRRRVHVPRRPWLEPVVKMATRRQDFEKAFFSNAARVRRRYGF